MGDFRCYCASQPRDTYQVGKAGALLLARDVQFVNCKDIVSNQPGSLALLLMTT
jgi:hypothetical protein